MIKAVVLVELLRLRICFYDNEMRLMSLEHRGIYMIRAYFPPLNHASDASVDLTTT